MAREAAASLMAGAQQRDGMVVSLENAINALQLALDHGKFGDVTDDEQDSTGEVESVIEGARVAIANLGAGANQGRRVSSAMPGGSINDDPSIALQAALVQAIEAAGFAISGPTDSRAAEHGEPAWVCNARAAIANLGAGGAKSAAASSGMNISCLFELDEHGEATGTVMPFCSYTCMCKAHATTHQQWARGVSNADDFGYLPHCEECGKELTPSSIKVSESLQIAQIATTGRIQIDHDLGRMVHDSNAYTVEVWDHRGELVIGTIAHDDEMNALVGEVMATTLRRRVAGGGYCHTLTPIEAMGLRGSLVDRIEARDWSGDSPATSIRKDQPADSKPSRPPRP